MGDHAKQNTEGRKDNAAEPLGERPGLVSKKGVERTGEASRRAAGPDGPDAGEVGETFRKPPN